MMIDFKLDIKLAPPHLKQLTVLCLTLPCETSVLEADIYILRHVKYNDGVLSRKGRGGPSVF